MKELERSKIIESLKEYFENSANVLMAFLFGSLAKNMQCSESDVDIAVYLKDEGKWEKVWNDVEDILNKDIDLVILNNARATIAWSAIKRGIPLSIKDRKLFIEFMLEVSREAEDFIDFNLDAWKRKYAFAKRG